MKLNELKDNAGARKSRIRVGRGIGSGKGKTAARGQKGQKSRSGVAVKGFEGGQMPLHMRIPKRGFNNPFGKDFAEVNLGMVQKFIDAKKLDAKNDIDHAALKAAGLAKGGKDGVRLLGKGALTTKAKFIVNGASKGALEAVEKAGGSVEILPAPRHDGGQGDKAPKGKGFERAKAEKAEAAEALAKKQAANKAK
ncbi:50S ribosomal protein L15 [Pontixanthobacter sp.]|uniref:50S ribosomal protein L15 n=1 Tax=Pontixanthobacter sp. TaxID=2792078 RepID=UPI003C7C8B16